MSNGNRLWLRRAALGWLTAGLLAMVVGGCAAGGGKKGGAAEAGPDLSAPVKPENRYKVSADPAAPFFRNSPQQPAGADLQVKKETRVTLVSKLAGYSKVKLPAGDIGYVDSTDIAHLSPKEIADEDALVAAQQAQAALLAAPMNNANIGNGGNYNPPPEAGRAEPLPLADPGPTATPPPSTMFRY